MRKSIAVIFFCLFTLSCKQTDTSDLVKVFYPIYQPRPITIKFKSYGDDFCSGTTLFNSDSTFITEAGCEGSSRITIGKWQLLNDTVTLIPTPKNKVNISFNYKLSNHNNCDSTTFIILDKSLKPIPDFLIQPFNKKPLYMLKRGQVLTEQNITNEINAEIYDHSFTNKFGIVKISKTQFDSLDLTKLNNLSDKKYRIKNKNLPDTVKLIIDINRIAFAYSSPVYWNIKHPIKEYYHGLKIYK